MIPNGGVVLTRRILPLQAVVDLLASWLRSPAGSGGGWLRTVPAPASTGVVLAGAEGFAEGTDRAGQGNGGPAGDLPLGLVLAVGLGELRELLLDLLGVLAGRAEQQLLTRRA